MRQGKYGMDLNFKNGIFSMINRLAYLLSPLSSFLYNLRRKYKGFDAVCGTGTRSNEEMFITALLKHAFSDEKLNSDMAMVLKDCVDLEKVLDMARKNGISQKLFTILKELHDNNIIEFMKLRLKKPSLTNYDMITSILLQKIQCFTRNSEELSTRSEIKI